MNLMPENVSSFGGELDSLTAFITWVTAICLILAEGILIYSVLRFRRSPDRPAQYTPGAGWRQTRWVLIPVMVVVALDFLIDVVNHRTWVEMKESMPAQGILVRVTGQQFTWNFTYPGPDGQLDTADDLQSNKEMHVPLGTDVTFELQAKDVLHSFWVPVLRLKQDTIPGRTIRGWFRATREGRFDIACAELCGAGHSLMSGTLVVESPQDFQSWLASRAAPEAVSGAGLLEARGCTSCHSTDGSARVGPSFKALFGRTETVVTGSTEREQVVDEDYLRRSLADPKVDVVKGFPPVMPQVQLTAEETDKIVDYLRTLK